jgi:WhiB family redox-sensing transcriptional regulator
VTAVSLAELWADYDHDASWRLQALCAGKPAEWWYPERGGAFVELELSKALCRSCPVRRQCLDYALATHQTEGVWGGMSVGERRRLHRD